MTELIAGPELDFEIAQAIGLEPLGIYPGWAPDGSFSWASHGDWKRVVVNYSKLWPEWTCDFIHEGYQDEYWMEHEKIFFSKFGHYTSCCAPAPEYSVDLNAVIEAAQSVGLFTEGDTTLSRTKYGWLVRAKGLYPKHQPTASLAICSAILEKVKNGIS